MGVRLAEAVDAPLRGMPGVGTSGPKLAFPAEAAAVTIEGMGGGRGDERVLPFFRRSAGARLMHLV